jgi:hypothetical protein
MNQPELNFTARRERAATTDEVLRLVALLSIHGWMKADRITALTSWPDRKIRAIANASEGRIISGQNGYQLTNKADAEEVRHSVNWLESQARHMLARAVQIRRSYHGAL